MKYLQASAVHSSSTNHALQFANLHASSGRFLCLLEVNLSNSLSLSHSVGIFVCYYGTVILHYWPFDLVVVHCSRSMMFLYTEPC